MGNHLLSALVSSYCIKLTGALPGVWAEAENEREMNSIPASGVQYITMMAAAWACAQMRRS